MRLRVFGCAFLLYSFPSWAFEHAKVLPKGVRNLLIRNVTTSLSEKSNATGTLEPLSSNLAQDLKLRKVVESKKGVEKNLLTSFLEANSLSLDDSVGTIRADIKGNVQVNAMALSYGLSEKLTGVFVLPYYQAKMAASYGFEHSQVAEKIVTNLHNPLSNQTAKAREVANTFNGANFLTAKLQENGFAELSDWSGSGVGDLVLGAKANFLDHERLRVASFSGVVAPTGKTKDPDNLLSVAFGDGTWKGFTSLILDEPILLEGLFLNQYAKYFYVAPSRGTFRMITSDEKLAVPKKTISYKLGDKADLGGSVQYEPDLGLLLGVGYNYSYKFKDSYDAPSKEVKSAMEKDSEQSTQHLESRLGYSTVPAFKQKKFPIPFNITAEYSKHLLSRNSPVKDLLSLELSVYF